MGRNPMQRVPPTGAYGISRVDFRTSRTARRLSYGVGAILLLVALLWAFGAFERAADTTIAPEPATAEGGARAPVAPVAPQ
jgi:hypothetical protein